MTTAVIVDAIRTPSGRGKPGGALSGYHPVDLLAETIGALVARSDLDPALIDDVIGGCLSQVGRQSVNITRNAGLAAGIEKLSSGGGELTYTYDSQRERTGISALLNDLNDAGIRFKDLQTTQSSLEDSFVTLVADRK